MLLAKCESVFNTMLQHPGRIKGIDEVRVFGIIPDGILNQRIVSRNKKTLKVCETFRVYLVTVHSYRNAATTSIFAACLAGMTAASAPKIKPIAIAASTPLKGKK